MGINEDCEYYTEAIDKISAAMVIRNKIKIEYGKKVTVDDLTQETNVINGLFPSGLIVITSTIQEWVNAPDDKALSEFRHKYIQLLLLRHCSGDWGIMHLEDRLANETALTDQGRIMSVYEYPEDTENMENKIWIITEWDRSITTVLAPEDY